MPIPSDIYRPIVGGLSCCRIHPVPLLISASDTPPCLAPFQPHSRPDLAPYCRSPKEEGPTPSISDPGSTESSSRGESGQPEASKSPNGEPEEFGRISLFHQAAKGHSMGFHRRYAAGGLVVAAAIVACVVGGFAWPHIQKILFVSSSENPSLSLWPHSPHIDHGWAV